MSDIFDEVEEDVRREHYEALWKHYGHHVLALLVVLCVGVAGWQWYQNYDRTQRMQVSDAYQAADALEQAGNYVGAEAGFAKLVATAPGGYRTLSRFRQAGAILAQGKIDAAANIYRELMNAPDETLADAARIRVAWMDVAGAPRSVVESDVKPLTAADSPWRYLAEEVLAYYDLRHGATQKAQAAYDDIIKAPGTTQGLRVRAQAFSEYIKANPDLDFAKIPVVAAPLNQPGATQIAPALSSPSSAAKPSAQAPKAAPAKPETSKK